MREHEIEGRCGRPQFGERLDVALHGSHALGHARLVGPAAQGGQRVDADVDHGDVRAGQRQRDGDAAAAATAVQHSNAGR